MESFGATQIRAMCPMCDKVEIVTVDAERYQAWKDGMLIQDAFPGMSDETRELLMTGMCVKCWNAAWEDV